MVTPQRVADGAPAARVALRHPDRRHPTAVIPNRPGAARAVLAGQRGMRVDLHEADRRQQVDQLARVMAAGGHRIALDADGFRVRDVPPFDPGAARRAPEPRL